MAPRNPEIPVSPQAEDVITSAGEVTPVATEETHSGKQPPMRIVWRNVVLMTALHIASLYGAYCLIWAHPLTWLWTLLVYTFSALGITAGAHRLWAHRSYKAKTPLRIFLAICNSMALQNDIIDWSRDHRMHHRHSETDADPHNASRGPFFAHIGWLLVRKHPDVKEKGKQIDVSDLYKDPVCVWQRRLYVPSVLLMCFAFPTVVPWYYWGESLATAYFSCALLRYCLTLNATWLVNSAAHMWGNRPYNINISPVQNIFVTFSAIGEGFHNYHHTFPHDYSTSEFGWKLNPTTFFIDCMEKLGQATNLKKVPLELVKRRMQKSGDGTEGFGFFQETDKQE